MDNDFKDSTESRLVQKFRHELQQAPTSEAAQMVENIRKLVLRAGKRSRPLLLQLTYSAYGGKDSETLVDVGVALELQHQFLLVHDDIMDDDTVRYDGLNMLGYYRRDFPADKTDIASSMALMAGNLLFTFACQAILEHPTLSDDKKTAVLALIMEANVGVHAGQQLDIVNVMALRPKIDNEKLLRTDYLKTAVYSVWLPMRVAAELLDLKAAEREKIDRFAHDFGILYQLTDDYSDYFHNASSFENHPKYRDFRQGKLTYPLLAGLERADSEAKRFLERHIGDKGTTDEEMLEVVKILEISGAQDASRQQITTYREGSLQALRHLDVDETARNKFVKMLDSFRI